MHKYLKRILVFSLLLVIIFSTSLTPVFSTDVVNADEKDKESTSSEDKNSSKDNSEDSSSEDSKDDKADDKAKEEFKNVSKEKNIFESDKLQPSLIKKTEYDINAQLKLTYNILRSPYGESGSAYASLYDGDSKYDVSSPKEQDLKKLNRNMGLNAFGKNALSDDIDKDTEEKNKDSEEPDKDEVAEVKDKLTKAYGEQIVATFGMKKDSAKVFKDTDKVSAMKDEGIPTILAFYKGINRTKPVVDAMPKNSSFVTIQKNANEASGLTYDDLDKETKKELDEIVKNKLVENKVASIQNKKDIDKSFFTLNENEIKSVFEDYYKKTSANNMKLNLKGKQAKNLKGKGDTTGKNGNPYVAPVSEGGTLKDRKSILVKNSDVKKVSQLNFIGNPVDMQKKVDNTKKDREKAQDKVAKDFNNKDKELLTKLAKNNKEYSTKVKENTSNVSLVSFTPIFPYLKDEEEYKEYADLTTKFTEGNDEFSATGSPFIVNDFLYKKNKSSPRIPATKNSDGDMKYALGSYNKDFVSNGKGNLKDFIAFDLQEKGNFEKIKNIFTGDNIKFDSVNKSPDYASAFLYNVSKDAGKWSGTDFTKNKTSTVGIDNYGNIIASEDGRVLVPYWNNNTIKGMNHKFASHPAGLNVEKGLPKASNPAELKVTAKDITDAFGDKITSERAEEAVNDTKGLVDSKEDASFLKGLGGSGGSKDDNGYGDGKDGENKRFSLALVITAKTAKDVESFNKTYTDASKSAKQSYVMLGNAGYEKENDSNSKRSDKYTVEDFLNWNGIMHASGFLEPVSLTLNSSVIKSYNDGFISTPLANVFYTDTPLSSATFKKVAQSFVVPLILLLSCLLLFWIYRLWTGKMKVLGIFKNTALYVIIILSFFLYSTFVNTLLNKPVQPFLGNMVIQNSIKDLWSQKTKEDFDGDPLIARFMEMDENKDMAVIKSKDYAIKFYTNETIEGQKITDKKGNNINLKNLVKKTDIEKNDKLNGYDKNELKTVSISSFDIKKWAEETIEEKTDEPLFKWVQNNSLNPDQYKNIGDLEEISVDTNTYLTKYQKENGFEESTNGYNDIKSSELFLNIYKSIKKDDKLKNLKGISEAMHASEMNGQKLSKGAKSEFIQDIASPAERRAELLGFEYTEGGNNDHHFPTTEAISKNFNITLPKDDFLGISDVVDKTQTNRTLDYTNTLNGDVFEINKDILNRYSSSYSQVRESLKTKADEEGFVKSENYVLALETFFEINKKFDLDMFPQEYIGQYMSVDGFLNMIFIPHKDFDPSNPYKENVAQTLIKGQDNLLTPITFILMIILMFIFGLVYKILFTFVLPVVTILLLCKKLLGSDKKFIRFKNWKIDEANTDLQTFALLFIYLLYALLKLGLVALWAFLGFTINSNSTMLGTSDLVQHPIATSSIVIMYLVIAFGISTLWLTKCVMKDPRNLGGGEIARGIDKVRSAFTSSVNRSSSASGRRSKTGRHFDSLKNSEGKDATVSSAITASGNSVQTQNHISSDLNSSRILGVQNAINQNVPVNMKATLRNLNKKMSGFNNAYNLASKDYSADKLRFIGNHSNANSNILNLESFENMTNNYSSIEADGYGVQKDLNERLSTTTINGATSLGTFAHNKLGSIQTSSPKEAQFIKETLNNSGYQSAIGEDNKVFFNTNGKDLNNQFARKDILSNLINASSENVKLQKPFIYNEDDSFEFLNYTNSSKGADIIETNIGRTGLSGHAFNDLITSKPFTDNFVITNSSKLVQSDDGSYYMDGGLELRHLGSNAVETNKDEAVKQIFKQDDKLRADIGQPERLNLSNDENNVTSLSLGDDQESKSRMQKIFNENQSLFKSKGIHLQDGKLRSNTPEGINTLKELRDEEYASIKDNNNFYGDIASKVGYNVTGEMTDGYDINQSTEPQTPYAKALGISHDTKTNAIYVSDMNKAKTVTNTLKGLEHYKNYDNIDSFDKNRNVLENFASNMDMSELVQLSKQQGFSTNDYEKRKAHLKQQSNKGDINEQDFKIKEQNLDKEFLSSLKKSGTLLDIGINKATSKQANNSKEIKEVASAYKDARQDILKNTNIKGADLDTVLSSGVTLKSLTKEAKTMKDVKMNPRNNVVEISSKGSLDDDNVPNIYDKLI